MNITVIKKPFEHCPIPYGHPLYKGYVPVEHTDIRQTWARAAYGDDFDLVERTAHLDMIGEFAK